MLIHEKPVIVYDIEIFPNVFHCCCKNTETKEISLFEISARKNQLHELCDFFRTENYLFCGYNNKSYDDTVIKYIMLYEEVMSNKTIFEVCYSLFNLSSKIVSDEEDEKVKKLKYSIYLFNSFDLLTMQFSSKLRVGLKEMQLTMHYKNVQEYEGDFTDNLTIDDIDKMIQYNINDVESTEELLYRLKDDIDIRLWIEEEYGFDALSMDSVKFGERILATSYCGKTGITMKELKEVNSPADYVDLEKVILPCISFKNQTLKDLLADMKSQHHVTTLEKKGYEKKFVLSNVTYSVGVGGIHSLHTPKIFVPKETEYIGHADVTSMYPSFIIQYHWVPRHLGEIFYDTYVEIYHNRVSAKHSGLKPKDKALKLTLNSVTGKMQEPTSWMYDPFTVFKIRINGQLVLLMLVDRLLELGCKIVQVNTDGVMYIAPKQLRDRVQEAIKEVEQITRLGFETDDYEAFYQYAGNDYFGVGAGYAQSHNPKLIEKKGFFITDTKLGKSLTPVIIPKAVINYFLTGQSVEDYICSHTDIKDFLMGQKVNKKFKVKHGPKLVQRINRYYASTNDYYLMKVDADGSETNLLTKSGVTILNKFDDKPISERHINYRYYISEANKIIHDFVCQQLELF